MKKGILILIILLAVLPAFAQEEASPSQTPEKIPRTLYLFPAESVSELGMDRRELLKGYAEAYDEYLAITIAENTDVVLVDSEEESDCKIRTVFTDIGEGEVGLTLFAYDVFFDREACKIDETYTDFSMAALFESYFPSVVENVRRHFAPRDPEIVEVVTEKVVEEVKVEQVYTQDMSTVTVRGVAGTEIETGTGKLYIIGETGTIDIEAPEESTLDLTATRPGYFPVEKDVIVGEDDIEIELEQTKGGRLVLDNRVRFTDGSLVPGIQFFIVPHALFVGFYLDENLLSVSSLVNGIAGYPIIPQLYPVLRFGQFFLRPDSPFRIAFSVGVFTKIVMPFTGNIYISKEMRVGLEPALLLEFSPWKRLRFYLEYSPRFYYRAEDSEFDFTYEGYSGVDDVEISDTIYMNPAVVFIGVRWYL